MQTAVGGKEHPLSLPASLSHRYRDHLNPADGLESADLLNKNFSLQKKSPSGQTIGPQYRIKRIRWLVHLPYTKLDRQNYEVSP